MSQPDENLNDWLCCSCKQCRADRLFLFGQETVDKMAHCRECSAAQLIRHGLELASAPKISRGELKGLLRQCLELLELHVCESWMKTTRS